MKISKDSSDFDRLVWTETQWRRLQRHISAVREHLTAILCIKLCLGVPEKQSWGEAGEAWFELTNQEQIDLYGMAPRNGGIFTTKEREILHSQEFRKAYYG